MKQLISHSRATLLHLLRKVRMLLEPREPQVPVEVRQALQQCENMEQLLDLLFATDFHKDEAFLTLFERRIGEIDPPF